MNRLEVIQKIINKIKAKSYLEIGVDKGHTFFWVKARKKVAVDPHFSFKLKHRVHKSLKNYTNITARYFQITSNDYFQEKKTTQQFDLIFIDGQHTYEQSLNDVINSLNCLSGKGVIVVHDCNPPNREAAFPAESLNHAALSMPADWSFEWCGDVWKTICFLRANRNDLNIFVLDCDFGTGVITKGIPEDTLNLDHEAIAKMTYDDLDKNRKHFLNLKPESYLDQFLSRL